MQGSSRFVDAVKRGVGTEQNASLFIDDAVAARFTDEVSALRVRITISKLQSAPPCAPWQAVGKARLPPGLPNRMLSIGNVK